MKWHRVAEKDDFGREGYAWLSDNSMFRITDAGPLEEPYELLRRIEQVWLPAGDPLETFKSLGDAKKEARELLKEEA